MQAKKLILTTLIIVVTLVSTSCFDSTEVDDMVYVLAIGVDNIDNSQINYTFQTAVPLNISSGVETGFAESEESVTLQSINITSHDLLSAIEKANSELAKELNISHCKLIIFSKNVTSDAFNQTITFINSNSDFSPSTLIAMCNNNASEYLDKVSSPFEKNPARYYKTFLNKDFSLQMFSCEVNEFEKKTITCCTITTA